MHLVPCLHTHLHSNHNWQYQYKLWISPHLLALQHLLNLFSQYIFDDTSTNSCFYKIFQILVPSHGIHASKRFMFLLGGKNIIQYLKTSNIFWMTHPPVVVLYKIFQILVSSHGIYITALHVFTDSIFLVKNIMQNKNLRCIVVDLDVSINGWGYVTDFVFQWPWMATDFSCR